MRILITGGLGFIGSNFVRFMLNNYPDVQVVNYDKATYAGNLNNLKNVENNPNYTFVKGDICDKKNVEREIENADVVFNFAAETHVDRSIIDAGTFVMTDAYGTCVLLEACRKYDVDKFIQISTDEIYGSIENGSFKETDRLNPSNPYSASKASADLLCNSYFVTYSLPILITRSSNNYGPFQHPEKFIPKTIINAILDKPVPVYGDGMNIRDWLFVSDNCEAIELVFKKGKNGEIYNIGSGNEKTNIDMGKLILQHLNKPETLMQFVPDRLGHDRRYSLDSSKIKELGWQPKINLVDGISKTTDWYINNKWWWESLI